VLERASTVLLFESSSAALGMDEQLEELMRLPAPFTKPAAAAVLLWHCLAAARRHVGPPPLQPRPGVTPEVLAAALRDAAVGLALSPNAPEPLTVGLVCLYAWRDEHWARVLVCGGS
jgi:hypothetical protein